MFVSGCEKGANSKHSSVAFSPDRHITKMESTSLDREPEETPSSSSVKERWAFSITISFSQQDVAVNMGKTPTFEVKWWRGTFLKEICCLFHRGLQQDQEHLIRGVEWQQIWCRAHATHFLVQHQYHRRAFLHVSFDALTYTFKFLRAFYFL